jgi:FixJ family two-component response regulator
MAFNRPLQRGSAAREEQAEIHNLRERYHALTARVREVMTLVVSGMLNKQIAYEIGASEATVKIHRDSNPYNGHARSRQVEALKA